MGGSGAEALTIVGKTIPDPFFALFPAKKTTQCAALDAIAQALRIMHSFVETASHLMEVALNTRCYRSGFRLEFQKRDGTAAMPQMYMP